MNRIWPRRDSVHRRKLTRSIFCLAERTNGRHMIYKILERFKGNLTLPMASRSMHLLHIRGLVIWGGVCLRNEDALEFKGM
jgi:hypothetical protein